MWNEGVLMRKIKHYITKNVNDTKKSILQFKGTPLNSMGQMFPVAMMCTSLVGMVIAWVLFVINGGYSEQISKLNGDLLNGISEGFTVGTTYILTSGYIPVIISVFAVAEMIILFVSYIKSESKEKKIIASICLAVSGLVVGAAVVIIGIAFGAFQLSYDMEMKIATMLSKSSGIMNDSMVMSFKIIGIIGVVAFIIFIILMFVSKHRWMIKDTVMALLVSFLVFPGLLLFLENVIPMILGIISIIFIAGFLFVLAKIFLSGEGGHSESYNPREKVSDKKELPKEAKSSNQKVINDWSGPFWRDKGGLGILQAQEDHIYCYNVWKEKIAVCGVSAFEKGTVAIIDRKTNRRVMNIAGCKTPAK